MKTIYKVNGVLESSENSEYKAGAKLASVTEYKKEDGERMFLNPSDSVKFREGIFFLENNKSIIPQKFIIYKLGKNWWYSRISQFLAEGDKDKMDGEIEKRIDLSIMDKWYFGNERDVAEMIKHGALEGTTVA